MREVACFSRLLYDQRITQPPVPLAYNYGYSSFTLQHDHCHWIGHAFRLLVELASEGETDDSAQCRAHSDG